MRFIETKKLNDYVLGAGDLLHRGGAEDLCQGLNSLARVSLQEVSTTHDRQFLREVASVLNVVVSIIYHPHLSNKHEEVILRIEQAEQLGREDFLDTIKDSRLWKEHDARMIPEEVHYHRYIDELRIYENRFIAFLVDLIDRELARFSTFYLSRLPSISGISEKLDRNQVGEIIMEIDRLRRKTQFIRNTYFYKEVSKGKPISPKVQPTNILVKDRLYRFCFRFYRSFARYEDAVAAGRDLKEYYTILILRRLFDLGYMLTSRDEDGFSLENGEFVLRLDLTPERALALNVVCRTAPDHPVKHLLGFLVEGDWARTAAKLPLDDSYETVELLSLWELCYADGGRIQGLVADSEEALVQRFLSEKLHRIPADAAVYKKYCPVCRARRPAATDVGYSCSSCGSHYLFDTAGRDATIWFTKIRKGGSQ